MFFRNVRFAAELTNSCKSLLLQPSPNVYKYGRLGCRSAYNSRKGARNGFQADPLENIRVENGPLHAKKLFKPFVFTIGVSAASLAGCVIWEYETLRNHASSLLRRPGAWLNAQQRRLLAQSKSDPGPARRWWSSLKDSEKVFYPILAANILVFGAWRVRSLQPIMVKYFCSNPSSKAVCLPMVLSTFSHYSALHLAANMYVLYSFMPGILESLSTGTSFILIAQISGIALSPTLSLILLKLNYFWAAIASLGKEQFVAMYLSAGVISSFASFLYKVVVNQPGLSLGASGAIMSVLSYVCLQYPDTRLSIIFLPMYTFAAGTAIKVIMTVDLAGVALGWKFFDHAAHLGGALFGMFWCNWGHGQIWENRDKFLQYYHVLRKNDPGR